ncbi:hypothetical protein ACFL3C_01185 [Patescibacteria group bacterium]
MAGSAKLKSKPKSLVSKKLEKAKGAVKDKIHGARVEISINRLSRKVLAKLSRQERKKELKRLQEELQGLGGYEKDELLDKVRAKTKRELAVYKAQMAETVKEKRLEDFMLELNDIFVATEENALEGFAARTAEQVRREELFYATLNTYVGKESNKKFLKAYLKSPMVQKLLSGLKALDEDTAKKINDAAEEGDYKKLRALLLEASDGELSAEHVDKVFGSAPYFKDSMKPVTGYKIVDWVINSVKSFKYLGYGFVMRAAKNDAEVPFFIIMQTANITLHRLRQIDDTFQSNLNFITSKQKQGLHDQKRLGFIDAIHKLRMALDDKINKPGKDGKTLQEKFDENLDLYMESLRKDKRLDEQSIAYIKAHAEIGNLRLEQMYELVYGDEKKRDRVVTRIFSRIPTAVRFYRRVMQSPELAKTLQKYHWERLKTRSARKFRRAAKGWGLEDVRSKGDALYKQVETFSPYGESSAGSKSERVRGEVLKEHDDILKKYYVLVNRTSKVLTANAQKILAAGGALEQFRKNYDLKAPIDWQKSPFLSDDTLEALFPGKKAHQIRTNRGLTGNKLVQAYTERLVELRSLQDTTRAYFSGMARDIEKRVAEPITSRWGDKMERLGRAESDRAIREGIEEIKTQTSPWKRKVRIGGKLLLPGILLAFETNALMTGKAKPYEFVWNGVEMVGGFCPGIGTVLDGKACITGRSLAGRKLSWKERLVSGVFCVVGAVADALTLVGGVGLGLRAGVGFLKGGRKAMQAGKTMKAMRQAGMARKSQSYLARAGMWIGGRFNRAARLEAATSSRITANAYDQARLMSKYKIDDLAHAEKELASTRGYLDAAKRADLDKLRTLMKSSEKYGYDYMNALRGPLQGILKAPSKIGAVGRTWLRVKSAFHKVKETLMALKIDPKIINQYEKTFDKIRALESRRAQAVEELAGLANKGRYFDKGESVARAGAVSTKVEKLEDLKIQQKTLARSRKASLKVGDATRKKYKAVPEVQDLLDKAKEGGKITRTEIAQAVKQARKHRKYKSLTVKELTDAVDHYKGASASLGKLKKLKQQRKTGFGEAVQAEGNTRQIMKKQKEVGDINRQIATLHNERFIMQTEMMYKAERAMDVANQWRQAVRFLQYGLVAGGIAFLTSMAPDKAVQTGTKVIKKTGKTVYKVGKKVFWDEHGGKPPMDKMIEDRLKKGKRSLKIKKLKKKVLGKKKASPDALKDDTGGQAKHD